MTRPHVVTHALVSADGRIEGFPSDVGLYYELAGRLPQDAILSGSGTMVAAARAQEVDLSVGDQPPDASNSSPADASLPLMVIVDSRGRVTRFDWLRSAGLWRDVLVLGTARTPSQHRERLRTAGVELEVCGADQVDLPAALHALREHHGIASVRVDAGPTLNTVMVAAGLVDEVSLLVAPHLTGSGRTVLDGVADAAQLTLLSAERQPNGHVWLRYAVRR